MGRTETLEEPSVGPRLHGLRTTGQYVVGMLAGGFAVQGLIIVVSGLPRLSGAPGWLIALGLALCPLTVVVTALIVWRRGHRIWGASIATGAISGDRSPWR